MFFSPSVFLYCYLSNVFKLSIFRLYPSFSRIFPHFSLLSTALVLSPIYYLLLFINLAFKIFLPRLASSLVFSFMFLFSSLHNKYLTLLPFLTYILDLFRSPVAGIKNAKFLSIVNLLLVWQKSPDYINSPRCYLVFTGIYLPWKMLSIFVPRAQDHFKR